MKDATMNVQYVLILNLLLLGLLSLNAGENSSEQSEGSTISNYSGIAHIRDDSITIYLTYISNLDEVAYILIGGDVSADYQDGVLRVKINYSPNKNKIHLLTAKKNNDNLVIPNQVIKFKVRYPADEKWLDIEKVELKFTEIEIPVKDGKRVKNITIECQKE